MFTSFAQSGRPRGGIADNSNSAQSAQDPQQVKDGIANILKEKIEIFDRKTDLTEYPTDIKVLDDKIEFKLKDESTAIYFSDLVDYPIQPVYFKKNKSVLSLSKFDFITGGFNNSYKRLVELRQDLIFFQNQFKAKKDEAQKVIFEQKVKEYRAMAVKPTVSEEQRKYIVQANLFNQQKNYIKAIELYTKVLAIDPIAYPAGYSNLALLCAQVNNFKDAIMNMKKYLALEPEASDARSAQDKIYEWEALMVK